MTPEERVVWQENRRSGIGGSDAAAVLGVSPWKSSFELWLEKKGELPPVEENEAMYWGTALEPVIFNRYQRESPVPVIYAPPAIVSDAHPFMRANLDGIAADRIVEIKTSRAGIGFGDPGSSDIPDYYMAQVQHNLLVARRSLADMPVLIGGSDYRVYQIEADIELQDMIIEAEQKFWSMVTEATPPEIITSRDVQLRFGGLDAGTSVHADEPTMLAVAELLYVRKDISALESRENSLKTDIQRFMKDASTLLGVGNQVLATWKMSKASRKLDVEDLKARYPEVYEECSKNTTETRRFLLKKGA